MLLFLYNSCSYTKLLTVLGERGKRCSSADRTPRGRIIASAFDMTAPNPNQLDSERGKRCSFKAPSPDAGEQVHPGYWFAKLVYQLAF